MRTEEITINQVVTIRKGWGYYDCTDYGIGGCFRRATDAIPVTVTRTFPPVHGCTIQGETVNGRKVAFSVDCLA